MTNGQRSAYLQPSSCGSSGSVANAAGRELAFATDDRDRVTVAGAYLLATDLKADNGCVNVIDRVLI